MARCWMRRIRIELISKIKSEMIVIGDNKHEMKKIFPELNCVSIASATSLCDDLNISISGCKYPSSLKDKGTIIVYNLSYATICKLVLGEYYKIKIYAGYESQGNDIYMIFNGSVAYISNKIHSNHDTECYIIFASDTVAQYSQNRMNFTLNSGINLYSALKYICMTSGISSYHLDENLRNSFLKETLNNYSSAATILDSASLSQTGNYTLSADGVGGTVVDVTTLKGKRVITIKQSDLVDGNPTVSSEGLRIILLPTFDFKVGDILSIDNALIDVSISSAESVTSTFNTNYMDTNGLYMIQKLQYDLQNRGNLFRYTIEARAVDIISKYLTE